MSLQERIRREFQDSRKAGDKAKASLLSTLVGDIETKRKSFKAERDLTDDEVIAMIRIYRKNFEENREKIAAAPSERSQAQLEEFANQDAMLAVYVPTKLDENELRAFVETLKAASDEKVADDPSSKPIDMGAVMAALKAEHPNAYDGKLASTITRQVLAS